MSDCKLEPLTDLLQPFIPAKWFYKIGEDVNAIPNGYITISCKDTKFFVQPNLLNFTSNLKGMIVDGFITLPDMTTPSMEVICNYLMWKYLNVMGSKKWSIDAFIDKYILPLTVEESLSLYSNSETLGIGDFTVG
jgi:hypothetical protein